MISSTYLLLSTKTHIIFLSRQCGGCIIEVKHRFLSYFNNLITQNRALSSLKVFEWRVEDIFIKCLAFEQPNNDSEFEYKKKLRTYPTTSIPSEHGNISIHTPTVRYWFNYLWVFYNILILRTKFIPNAYLLCIFFIIAKREEQISGKVTNYIIYLLLGLWSLFFLLP